MNQCARRNFNAFVSTMALLSIAAAASDACTVFVITDGRQVLFCSNEETDVQNPAVTYNPPLN
jgi:hypothetical protein